MLNKKSKKTTCRLFAILLAILMIMPMQYVTAAETSSNLDNLVVNKEAVLEDDGTYTITLEAYAKGQVETTTVKQVIPTDIVLVLDQSGSMVQNNITGIPSGTYTEANPTNAEVASGTYYYLATDGNYYKVTATKEIISQQISWVGDNGQIYTDDQLSYSWTRKSDGQVYNTARPFVTETLSTWTRTHEQTWFINTFKYLNDATGAESSANSALSAADARSNFQDYYTSGDYANYTVEFHNDGAPAAGDTSADDPYYVAAVYMAVTKQEVFTYRYTYTYTDASGKVVTIGTSDTGVEATIDSAACAVNPLYVQGTTTGTRLDALKYAAEKFINDIRDSALVNGVDHRVAIVGFGAGDDGNDYYYMNTELLIGENQYNYAVDGLESTHNTTGNLALDKYDEAFQSAGTDTGYSNLLKSVNVLAGEGATRSSLGFAMANGIFNANSNSYTSNDGTTGTRNRIVIFLTDGEPGYSGYDSTEASSTLNNVNTTKNTYGAKVFTVAVLDSTPTDESDIDIFLKNTSSDGSYTLATSTEALDNFFQTVDKDINDTTTTVTLTENTYVVDRLSDYFIVPEGFSVANNVVIQTAQHVGDEAFTTPIAAPSSVTATVTTNTEGIARGIYVKGFNFISDENVVTTSVSDGGSTIANGNKLVVTITGLLAKDEAATNTYLNTNTEQSGIWDVDTEGTYGMVKAFNMPTTMITKKAYVLDYAKEAVLNAFATSATKIDSSEDLKFSKVSDDDTALTGAYGKAAVVDGKLTYEPTTMMWSGFDTFYALGKDNTVGDQKTKNIWSKVSVIPANNVYYEDDFVTNPTTGIVGIVYSGTWTTDGTTASNTESANTEVHGGWKNVDLADDTTYSDGSAHVGTVTGETATTATFTFTGTGVDVYSRTNLTTGCVKAQLYTGTEVKAAALTKVYTIDNKAASGASVGYYQIPTVSFMNLEEGTYTVRLTVVSTDVDTNPNDSTDDRKLYYLDGIRVYNPLPLETEYDEIVSGAYGSEINSIFTEVRDILIEAGSFDAATADTTDGVVFIDETTDATGTTSSVMGTYVEYGPKNEVYLAKNQAIAFSVKDAAFGTLSVGLKAPDGTTSASVTNGDATSALSIGHASDLYYELTPSTDGLVIIKNTGDNLLSITKLKMSGELAVEEVSVMSLMAYSDEFDTLEVVEYEPVVEEETPDTGDDSTGSEDNTGDVEIETPETDQNDTITEIKNWITNIINSFRNWFK